MDAAIVHPLAPSTPYSSVRTGTKAIVEKEDSKLSDSSERCRLSNVTFSPFVLTTFEKVGEHAKSFFKALVKARKSCGALKPELELSRRYTQQLQLEVARMLLLVSPGTDTNVRTLISGSFWDRH